ncbi:hypothetical protein ACQY0O_005171 [Thecaphora frezii]
MLDRQPYAASSRSQRRLQIVAQPPGSRSGLRPSRRDTYPSRPPPFDGQQEWPTWPPPRSLGFRRPPQTPERPQAYLFQPSPSGPGWQRPPQTFLRSGHIAAPPSTDGWSDWRRTSLDSYAAVELHQPRTIHGDTVPMLPLASLPLGSNMASGVATGIHLPPFAVFGIVALTVGTRRFETRPSIRPLELCVTNSGSLYIDVSTGTTVTCHDLLAAASVEIKDVTDCIIEDTSVRWPYVDRRTEPDNLRNGQRQERLGLFAIRASDVAQCWVSSANNPGYLILRIRAHSATAQTLEAYSAANAFFQTTKAHLSGPTGYEPTQRIVLQLDVQGRSINAVEKAVLASDGQRSERIDLSDPAIVSQLERCADDLQRTTWLRLVDRIQQHCSCRINWLNSQFLHETIGSVLQPTGRATSVRLPHLYDFVRLRVRLFCLDGDVYRASKATLAAANPQRNTFQGQPSKPCRPFAWTDPDEPQSADWSMQRVVWLRLAKGAEVTAASSNRPKGSEDVRGSANAMRKVIKVEAMIADPGQFEVRWNAEVEADQDDVEMVAFGRVQPPLIVLTLKRNSTTSQRLAARRPDARISCSNQQPEAPVTHHETARITICLDLDTGRSSEDAADLMRLKDFVVKLRDEMGEDKVVGMEDTEAQDLLDLLGIGKDGQ